MRSNTLASSRSGDRAGSRPDRRVQVRDADGAADAFRPQRLHRQAVAKELMVHRRQGIEEQAVAGRMGAQGVAVEGDRGGLVQRHPLRHAVAEPLAGGRAVLGEPFRRRAVHPAAPVLEGERRVPVVQGGHGGDAGGEQLVDEAVVEVQAGGVEGAAAPGLDPRPGDREPVGVDPELAHEPDVFVRAVIVIAGDGGGVPVQDVPRLLGKGVPAGGPAAAGRRGCPRSGRPRRRLPG